MHTERVADRSVCICHTLYHVYIALLKQFMHAINADIVLVDTIPDVEALSLRLRAESVFANVITIRRKNVFVDSPSFHFNYLYIRIASNKVRKKMAFLDKYDNVSIFNDYTEVGAYLNFVGIPYHLIEDGCDCYKKTDQYAAHGKARAVKRFLKKRFGIPSGLAEGKCIIDIEVNDARDLRTRLNLPVIEIPRRELMELPSEGQIAQLFRVFDAEDLKKIKDNSAIILTEPLWEKGVTKRGHHTVEYYAKIAACLEVTACYIKPHPRDGTDYSSVFSKDNIIDKNLPIELLNYLGSKRLAVAVSFSSTSIGLLTACRTKLAIDSETAKGDVCLLDRIKLERGEICFCSEDLNLHPLREL